VRLRVARAATLRSGTGSLDVAAAPIPLLLLGPASVGTVARVQPMLGAFDDRERLLRLAHRKPLHGPPHRVDAALDGTLRFSRDAVYPGGHSPSKSFPPFRGRASFDL